ncbi:hypothetical protein [Deinococcus sp. Marseille-Q6407]|uniref:hypothetical protein n=1 Tax=Deinococcus sp. Marseille-Q6407 TaxID=2969223 RepID=UPI0021BE501D|nr:hypothetical protein [Deinococcus sp. Marseille-Q6407]
MASFSTGDIVSAYCPEYRERVTGGLLELGAAQARVLVPNGSAVAVDAVSLSPAHILPLAPLRPGDLVCEPGLYPDAHEVVGVDDLLLTRHVASGSTRMFFPGTVYALRRTDLADLYADFKLPAPKPARMEGLF